MWKRLTVVLVFMFFVRDYWFNFFLVIVRIVFLKDVFVIFVVFLCLEEGEIVKRKKSGGGMEKERKKVVSEERVEIREIGLF